jgi:hypothetical protein
MHAERAGDAPLHAAWRGAVRKQGWRKQPLLDGCMLMVKALKYGGRSP